MVFSLNLISFVKNDSYGSKKDLMYYTRQKTKNSYQKINKNYKIKYKKKSEKRSKKWQKLKGWQVAYGATDLVWIKDYVDGLHICMAINTIYKSYEYLLLILVYEFLFIIVVEMLFCYI